MVDFLKEKNKKDSSKIHFLKNLQNNTIVIKRKYIRLQFNNLKKSWKKKIKMKNDQRNHHLEQSYPVQLNLFMEHIHSLTSQL